MQSVIIYGAMIISSVFFANRAKNTGKKRYLLYIVLILSFICGCRADSVGNDTLGYRKIYENIIISGESSYSEMEEGYTFLCKVILAVYPNVQAVFIVVALITYALVVWRLWEVRDIAEFDWAVMCFVCSFHFFIQSGMRQGIALAVVFWSTRFLEKNNYTKYIVGVLIASLLHKTAIFACINVFFTIPLWNKLSIQKQVFLGISVLALPFAARFFMQNYTWERYSELFTSRPNIGLRALAEGAFAILSYIAFEYCSNINSFNLTQSKYTIEQGKRRKYVPMMDLRYRINTVKLYYIIGLLIGLFGYVSSTLGRMQLYWYWYQPIFMGMLARSRVNRAIMRFLIFAFMMYIFFDSFIGNGYSQIPYIFFWKAGN